MTNLTVNPVLRLYESNNALFSLGQEDQLAVVMQSSSLVLGLVVWTEYLERPMWSVDPVHGTEAEETKTTQINAHWTN